jgi:hypothetical protein
LGHLQSVAANAGQRDVRPEFRLAKGMKVDSPAAAQSAESIRGRLGSGPHPICRNASQNASQGRAAKKELLDRPEDRWLFEPPRDKRYVQVHCRNETDRRRVKTCRKVDKLSGNPGRDRRSNK